MATLEQAIEQMYAAGMPSLPNGIAHVDGRLHRYGPKGEARSARAYYKLYDYPARNGRRYITGFFGRWDDINLTKIRADFAGIEPDELRRLQQAQALSDKKERDKREARSRFAGVRARAQWDAARARLSEGETVPYLERKKLAWEKGLRVLTDGTLLVPMVRYDVKEEHAADPAYTGPLRLAGLQKIDPAGVKRFNRGTDPVGAMCRFGPKPKDGELFLVGEGLATVLAAHQVLERAYTSFVAFTAGNLAPAAKILRSLYPNSPVLFLADDDAYLEAQLNAELAGCYGARELYKCLDAARPVRTRSGEIGVHASINDDPRGTPVLTAGVTVDGRLERTIVRVNAGRTKSWEAANAIGNAWAAWPQFVDRALFIDPEARPRLTDWNDLLVTEGPAVLVAQLGAEIKRIEELRELAKAMAAGAPRGPDEKAGGGGRKGGDGEEPDWELHGSLLRRFTLIERSDMAWDVARGYLWRVPHMRLTFGNKAVGMWLASPRRRSVDLERVVFDPLGAEDKASSVNLFRGIEMKPAGPPASCAKLLELLQYLCGEEQSDLAPVTDWVLKWCAYPLQHVGAKMRTAVVMYGPERTGKNLFWGALRAIYGRYGALITQAELEDKHNTWMSAKLFIIANEVVTRAEMSHHVGRLKHMVTEDEIYINPKMVDQRYEKNHANLTFLSNELQPLKIFPGDERFMVIRTPVKRGKEFYREVGAELKAGAAGALMRYLLALDLADFNEFTVPIENEAKAEVIEAGLFPSQIFWGEIKAGLLPFPYAPCLSEDLYHAYTVWCRRNGHKMPEAHNRFSGNFMRMNGVRRDDARVPDPDRAEELALVDETKLRKRRLFFMGEPALDLAAERQRVLRGVKEFRQALKGYLAEGQWRYSDRAAQAGGRYNEEPF